MWSYIHDSKGSKAARRILRKIIDKLMSAHQKNQIREAEINTTMIFVPKLEDCARRMQNLVAQIEIRNRRIRRAGRFVLLSGILISWNCPECNKLHQSNININYIDTEIGDMIRPSQYHFCKGNHGNILHITREGEFSWIVRAIDVVEHNVPRWTQR